MNQIPDLQSILDGLQCDRGNCICHKDGGGEHVRHCPAHDDRNPSLSVTGNGDQILVYCHSGCDQNTVIEALRARGLWGQVYPSVNNVTALPSSGLTVEALASAKQLSLDSLREFGVSNCKYQGASAVRIPYSDSEGNLLAVRYRVGLGKDGMRFKWRKGDRAILYGLNRLKMIRQAGWVLLVEGESDCWSCWEKNLPALGIPGKNNWRDEWAGEYLQGLEVFLWQEPDAPDLVLRIAKTFTKFRVIRAPNGIKDPNEAHVQGHDIAQLIDELKGKSIHVDSILRELRDEKLGELERVAAPVLELEDPLQLVEQGIRRRGYGGDIRPAKIVYLAATARVLEMRAGSMLVHLLLIGTPSAGKSWTVKCVLHLLPDDAFHVLDAASPRALIYDDSDLRHRVVVFGEADSLPNGEDNPAASAVRNLLQDGRLHYTAVVRNPDTGDFGVREVNKAGPTVLITTSVRRLGEQLMTRFFTLEMVDTEEQVRAALKTQAALELNGASSPDPALVAFQAYLQARAGWDVLVPFAQELADEIGKSSAAPRILRDFARLISLIKSVAVIRHRHRKLDASGKVIAQIEDYATIYELIGEMYSGTVSGASKAVREVVEKVTELKRGETKPITITQIAEVLGISKMAASRRVRSALTSGWLANNESRRGHPADLDLGEPLPNRVGLPEPGELAAKCNTVTPLTDGYTSSTLEGEQTAINTESQRGPREEVVL